jgi:leucyl-tRNA synthetase
MSSLADEPCRNLKRLIHSTIDRVTRDIRDERQLNTAVARLMELCNGLAAFAPKDGAGRSLFREGVESLLLCLCPFCPHICEELWSMMGHGDLLARAKWPEVDEEALVADSVTIVLQVNGKLREQFSVAPGMSREELIERVMGEEATKRRIEGMEVVKVVAVPDKLVNIVAKG